MSRSAVELRGDWQFFPGSFLSNAASDVTPVYVKVPGSWNSYYPAAAIGGGQGFGTYRIQIRTTDQDLA
ncbi:MAG TPA: hypothetical protein PLB73_15750, partial [Leptospiraceae bacterium]|nr:hypothetical protein [Leptospiraceae bacterium]